jgi:FdhD protein
VVVSKSAPTEKAVRIAEAYGVTLCGFARGRRVNIYTHSERVDLGA